MNRAEKYRDQGLNPDKTYIAECSVCGETHEWQLDDGFGGAFGQGWVDCPEYGPVPTGKEKVKVEEKCD